MQVSVLTTEYMQELLLIEDPSAVKKTVRIMILVHPGLMVRAAALQHLTNQRYLITPARSEALLLLAILQRLTQPAHHVSAHQLAFMLSPAF